MPATFHVGSYRFDTPARGQYTKIEAIATLMSHSQALKTEGVGRGQGVTLSHVIHAMINHQLVPLKEPSKLLRRVRNAQNAEAAGRDWKSFERGWAECGRRAGKTPCRRTQKKYMLATSSAHTPSTMSRNGVHRCTNPRCGACACGD